MKGSPQSKIMLAAATVIVILTVAVVTLYSSKSSKDFPRDLIFLNSLQSDYDNGKYDELILKAETRLQEDPEDIEALRAVATTYAMKGSVGFSEKGNGTKALEYADRILSRDPANSEAYRIKGYAHEIQEQYDQAHQNYDKAIELDPKNFQALSNKGHAYDLQGNLDEAENYYLQSIQKNINGEHVLVNLSRLYIRRGQIDKAKEYTSRVTSISNNSRLKSEAYQIRGELHRRLGEYDAALADINIGLALDHSVPQLWVTRGYLYVRKALEINGRPDNLQQAWDSAERALSINPNQAAALTLKYDIELARNNKEGAQQFRQQALNALKSDITLGVNEKDKLRFYLENDFQLISSTSSNDDPSRYGETAIIPDDE